jgi:hypothetical protein
VILTTLCTPCMFDSYIQLNYGLIDSVFNMAHAQFPWEIGVNIKYEWITSPLWKKVQIIPLVLYVLFPKLKMI